MKRVFNFSPGPAMLPEPVLLKAQAELLDWQGSGMSVMEVSHRGTDFIELAARSERVLRELLGVPERYKVLFLQGGATLQFAAVPLNLAPPGSVADYVVTEIGARGRAKRPSAIFASTSRPRAKRRSSRRSRTRTWQVSSSAAYLHYTRTRPCSASSSTTCPKSRTRRSSPTCRRRCYRARST
jgi:phosphoserine aminotransferase